MEKWQISNAKNNLLSREVTDELKKRLESMGIICNVLKRDIPDEDIMSIFRGPELTNFRSANIEVQDGAWFAKSDYDTFITLIEKKSDEETAEQKVQRALNRALTCIRDFKISFEISNGRTQDYCPSSKFPEGSLKLHLRIPRNYGNYRQKVDLVYRVDNVRTFNYKRITEKISNIIQTHESSMLEYRAFSERSREKYLEIVDIFKNYKKGYSGVVRITDGSHWQKNPSVGVNFEIEIDNVENARNIQEVLDFARTKLTKKIAPKLHTVD